MTLAESLRPLLHSTRGLLGELGFRPFSVSILSRPDNTGNTWDGINGINDPVAVPLTEANGQNPKVRWITPKEYLQGYPPDVVLEVRITPDLVAIIEQLNISSAETIWLVQGPGLGATGAKFCRDFVNTESALHWTIGLKRVSTSEL